MSQSSVSEPEHHLAEPSRVEIFSDGVFAMIITSLVTSQGVPARKKS
jgi:uncharacterized membrane protein